MKITQVLIVFFACTEIQQSWLVLGLRLLRHGAEERDFKLNNGYIDSPHGELDKSVNIVGGEESLINEFPWMISMQIGDQSCGASIVNSEWVVTAAHCTHTQDLSQYTLIAGDHNLTYFEGNEQTRSAVLIVEHPFFNPSMYENDISLLKVSPAFEINEFVQPVALASSKFIPTAIQTVTGWGRLAENREVSEVLMKVDIPFVTDDNCRRSYGTSRIKDSMICAGTGGKDACQGDSGGPLLCKYGKNSFLCGITSFGNGCARPNFPGVFTEVSYYTQWINSVITS